MQYHFAEEERLVFPSLQQFLQPTQTIIDDLLREHRQMETMVYQMKKEMDNPEELEKLLSSFGELLEKHIRREENELFPLFEDLVPEKIAIQVGQKLQQRQKELRKSELKVGFQKFLHPMLPNEHGAWAVWIVPFIIGTTAAGKITWQIIPLFFATLFLFTSYFPLTILIRSREGKYNDEWNLLQAKLWLTIYLTLGFLCGLPLVLVAGRPLLLLLAALAWGCFSLYLFLTRDKPKGLAGDLAAVMGLTFTAPAAYYTLKGAIDATAFSVWILNLLFFFGTVFYVHMKIDARAAKKEFSALRERLNAGKFTLLYYLSMLAVIVMLVLIRIAPPQVIVAYLPMTVHAVYGTIQLTNQVSFKRLGFALLGQSLIFGILFVMIFR